MVAAGRVLVYGGNVEKENPKLSLLHGLSLDPWGEPWCRGYTPWGDPDSNPTFVQPDRRKVKSQEVV